MIVAPCNYLLEWPVLAWDLHCHLLCLPFSRMVAIASKIGRLAYDGKSCFGIFRTGTGSKIFIQCRPGKAMGHLLQREVFIAIWILIGLAIVLYLVGVIRFG